MTKLDLAAVRERCEKDTACTCHRGYLVPDDNCPRHGADYKIRCKKCREASEDIPLLLDALESAMKVIEAARGSIYDCHACEDVQATLALAIKAYDQATGWK